MRFESPLYALLLLVFPLLWYLRRRGITRQASLTYASLDLYQQLIGPEERLKTIVKSALIAISLVLMILALMRPQLKQVREDVYTEGIDILLAIDVSGSMQALDFNPKNRLTVVKEVVESFVKDRKNDRIGIVTFSGTTQIRSPLTLDHNALAEVVGQIDFNQNTSTAIGVAIASTLNRLKDSPTKTKIAILLTDGENTAGDIDPVTASKLAAELGIKVYTIGVGKKGPVPFPVKGLFGGVSYQEIPIDEETLQKIAQNTGGKFFRATDPETLRDIYDEIAKLETSKIRTPSYLQYKDVFSAVLWLLLLAFGLETLINRYVWRVFP